MQNTTNLNLKKPDQTDYVNISDINDNMDVIDAALVKKYEKPVTGVPKIDLAQSVQDSLNKANSALQTVTKSDIGLENVDNTSDAKKPVSEAQQTALDKKADLASPKFTGVPTAPTPADSTNNTQLATTEFVQKKVAAHQTDYIQHIGYAIATGLANEYIATLTPALSKYQEGVSLRLKINVDNTGASTVNVNELGPKAIKKANGADVTSGNLKSGSVYTIVYNGTNFILQGEGGELSDADLLTFINDVNTLTKM